MQRAFVSRSQRQKPGADTRQATDDRRQTRIIISLARWTARVTQSRTRCIKQTHPQAQTWSTINKQRHSLAAQAGG
jgi:hypothetical protein